MPTESAKVRLDAFVGGLTVFQTIGFLSVVVPAIYALWSWRDGMVLEKASLQTHLIQAEARTNLLEESLKHAETNTKALEQTTQELRASLARRASNNSRVIACDFLQKQIAAVKTDISETRYPMVVLRESNEDREDRSRHLARLYDQLRTLTASLEACAR